MFILPFPNMTTETSFFVLCCIIHRIPRSSSFVCLLAWLLVLFWPLILVDSSIAKSRIRAAQCIIKNKSNV